MSGAGRPRKPPRLWRAAPDAPYYILYHDGTRDRRRATGARDDQQAERKLAAFIEESQLRKVAGPKAIKRRVHEISVAEAIATYIREVMLTPKKRRERRGETAQEVEHGARSSARQTACYAKNILRFFKAGMLDDLTPSAIKAYMEFRDEEVYEKRRKHREWQWQEYNVGRRKEVPPDSAICGITDSALTRELTVLRSAVNHLRKYHGVTGVPFIPMPAQTPGRDRWLTTDEAEALLRAAQHDHLQLFIRLALTTGSRKSALLELRWTQVDLPNRRIYLNPPDRTQTAKKRPTVPISDPLYHTLLDAHKRAKTEYVVEYAGRAPLVSIQESFNSAVERAGLSNDVTPHVLRHTAGTWMAQAGVDLYVIGGILGHTQKRTTELYAHHHPDYLKAGTEALAARLSSLAR